MTRLSWCNVSNWPLALVGEMGLLGSWAQLARWYHLATDGNLEDCTVRVSLSFVRFSYGWRWAVQMVFAEKKGLRLLKDKIKTSLSQSNVNSLEVITAGT